MSGESEKDSAASRSKDGVPSWNGEASSFVAYEEPARLWEQGLVYNKRYTAAPRLMAELTGAAKRLVAGKPAEDVAFVGVVQVLLSFLRRALGKPQVTEVTDLLGKYFKGTRRRSGESMNEYITRKSEAFMRVSQALKRVQPHYRRGNRPEGTYYRGRRGSDPWSFAGTTTWSRQTTDGQDDDQADRQEAATGNDGTDDGATTGTWGQGTNSAWSWNSGWSYSGWTQGSWDWYADSWWSGNRPGTNATPPTWSSLEAVEDESLLPSFIQGWYLLTDAALDSAERNIITTALGGDYSPARVAQELRNQFPEQELRRKDHGRRSHAYVSTEDAYEDHDAELPEEPDALYGDDLTAEGVAMLADAETEEQQALAAMGQARRTLKEARMRQHSVKMNRQYYRSQDTGGSRGSGSSYRAASTTGGGSSSTGASRDANMICLGCGVKGHRVANCPNKNKSEAMHTNDAENHDKQHAPFVCYAETSESALTVFPSTSQAVNEGYAIIDGGATKTLGSVHAVEALLRKNQEHHGNPRLAEVDKDNQPLFGFGNSSEGRCISTCKVGVQAGGQGGHVQIHALNEGTGPILLSIDALRKLGAIVDFKEDLLVLTAIYDKKIIPLRRSSTGHQLLSLVEDLFHEAHDAKAQKLSFAIRLLLPRWPDMERLTRPELVLHLRALGEESPENWTRLEIKQRIQEINEETPSMTTAAPNKTPLETQMAQLSKNSRKKSTLREHLEKELNIEVNDMDTVAAMQRKATNKILQECPVHGADAMGFGKYSQLSLQETYLKDPDYCRWARATKAEGPCNIRLERFVRWLEKTEEEGGPKDMVTEAIPKTSRPKARGYKAQPSSTASSSSAPPVPVPDPRDELLLKMTAALQDLREEVDQLRTERPRKVTSNAEK
ncbi:hypothetical protein AK812_SmicGene9941 [Symbiodinium microadriaticum]|uniref:CCHC-type domain-containing protein n=1 Tax=Symbiodinium microadriaticum TaxID=2951 RepID=A0A1Q9EH22_SYMMI|nr:hypothetical protein AK812_SmicGene9941 [Symbiodinium microadriaticum]